MLIDLKKTFHFDQQKNAYDVDYVFEKAITESNGLCSSDVCLIVTFSKNYGNKITDKTEKASLILYQSNESIEALIKAKVLSYN
jgi:hypothetical protein